MKIYTADLTVRLTWRAKNVKSSNYLLRDRALVRDACEVTRALRDKDFLVADMCVKDYKKLGMTTASQIFGKLIKFYKASQMLVCKYRLHNV